MRDLHATGIDQMPSWREANSFIDEYADKIHALDTDAAQVRGRLRVPHAEHALDKQTAAIAPINGLTVVTRNTADFAQTGVSLRNPFAAV